MTAAQTSILRRLGLAWSRLLEKSSSTTVATIVLCVGVVLTVTAWQAAVSSQTERAKLRFDDDVEKAEITLRRRMIGLSQILHGGAGLFAINNQLNRQEWQTYVSNLHLEEHFPGILGVGFSLRVTAAQKEILERQVRASGMQNFAIRPASPRDEYHTIVFLEPAVGRNLRAFGYDMFTEATRQTAMARARDQAQTALSGRVILVQETKEDVQPGFLLYQPVYRRGQPIGTEAQRREALLGFVYMPLRARDLFSPLLNSYAANVDVEIFDGDKISPDTLLYASRATGADRKPLLEKIHRIEMAGTTWTLRHRTQPSFEASLSKPWGVLLAGLILSFLLAGAVWSLAWTRNRAWSLARSMTLELGRSESRLNSIVGTAPDAIVTLDQEGIITSLNHTSERMFGQSAENLLGGHISNLIPDLGGRKVKQYLARPLQSTDASASSAFDASGLRANGDSFPISIALGEFADDGRSHLSLIIRDVSAARLAAADLLLRERALESSTDGVVISDMTLPDQPIIYVNPAFERITGYRRDEVLGRNCRFLQGPETSRETVAKLHRAVMAGQPCDVILRNYRKDGSLFWNELSVAPVISADGRATHFIGVQNDITARVNAERTLQLRKQRLDAVFSLSPDGFVGFDDKGELSLFNPAFERMTGLGEEHLLGLREAEFDTLMQSLCDPGQPYPAMSSGTDESGDGNRRQFPGAVLNLMKPAQRILHRSAYRNGEGSGEKVYYFRDITRESEVDRMKSEFLSTAAHELRTPLASIYGFTELLLNRNFDETARRDMLGTIHKHARTITGMVNELLDLARIEARAGKDFRRQPQPLLPLVQDTVASLMIPDDPRHVELDLPEYLPQVNVDGAKFAQALTNVLSNAYKYSPGGGTIHVTAIERIMGGRQVGICVRDEGIGMTPEQLGRIFERFYRADPSGNIPGTGLGMSLVKEIIELLGGAVEVASEPDQGTAVTLWLPVVAQPTAQAA